MQQLPVLYKIPCYNANMYKPPWIARVDFSSESPLFIRGKLRVDQAHEASELVVYASPGEIVALCQERRRQRLKDPCKYHLVLADGNLSPAMKQDQARRAWRATWGRGEEHDDVSGDSDKPKEGPLAED